MACDINSTEVNRATRGLRRNRIEMGLSLSTLFYLLNSKSQNHVTYSKLHLIK